MLSHVHVRTFFASFFFLWMTINFFIEIFSHLPLMELMLQQKYPLIIDNVQPILCKIHNLDYVCYLERLTEKDWGGLQNFERVNE